MEQNEAIVMAEVELLHTSHRKATWNTSHQQIVAHAVPFGLLGQGQAGTQGWHKGQKL